MGRSAKISISVPDTLFQTVEQARNRSKETRSDFFRRAAETLLRTETEREAIDRYVKSYLDHPETEEDNAWAKLGESQLAEVTW